MMNSSTTTTHPRNSYSRSYRDRVSAANSTFVVDNDEPGPDPEPPSFSNFSLRDNSNFPNLNLNFSLNSLSLNKNSTNNNNSYLSTSLSQSHSHLSTSTTTSRAYQHQLQHPHHQLTLKMTAEDLSRSRLDGIGNPNNNNVNLNFESTFIEKLRTFDFKQCYQVFEKKIAEQRKELFEGFQEAEKILEEQAGEYQSNSMQLKKLQELAEEKKQNKQAERNAFNDAVKAEDDLSRPLIKKADKARAHLNKSRQILDDWEEVERAQKSTLEKLHHMNEWKQMVIDALQIYLVYDEEEFQASGTLSYNGLVYGGIDPENPTREFVIAFKGLDTTGPEWIFEEFSVTPTFPEYEELSRFTHQHNLKHAILVALKCRQYWKQQFLKKDKELDLPLDLSLSVTHTPTHTPQSSKSVVPVPAPVPTPSVELQLDVSADLFDDE